MPAERLPTRTILALVAVIAFAYLAAAVTAIRNSILGYDDIGPLGPRDRHA